MPLRPLIKARCVRPRTSHRENYKCILCDASTAAFICLLTAFPPLMASMAFVMVMAPRPQGNGERPGHGTASNTLPLEIVAMMRCINEHDLVGFGDELSHAFVDIVVCPPGRPLEL